MSKRQSRKNRGINTISVCGFKSLAFENKIEIAPLTILSGSNSCGKSSIMQPILLMKQTLEESYDPGALLLHGSHVRFTSTEQILFKNDDFSVSEFYVMISMGESDATRIHFRIQKGKPGFQIKQMDVLKDGIEITLRPKMTKRELKELESLSEFVPKPFREMFNVKEWNWSINRERCFLRVSSEDERLRFTIFPSNLEKNIRRIIHIPGLRGNPERKYPTTAVDETNFICHGTFEKYVASIINNWQRNKREKELTVLRKYMKSLNLTTDIQTKQINDTEVEIYVGKSVNSDDLVSIADVGLGVSQTLPIVVALIFAQPGQIVYIEQPEIHLHPRAQYEISKLLVEAANRGVKVMIETHSSILLRGIQTLVANDTISRDSVKLNWFSINSDSGSTVINSADFDKNGSFGDWPVDFDDISLMADMNYLDAVESRED